MDTPMNSKAAIEVPPWERAHRVLDELREETARRLANIDNNVQQLIGEREALIGVLTRINSKSPAGPMPPNANPAMAPIGIGPGSASIPYKY